MISGCHCTLIIIILGLIHNETQDKIDLVRSLVEDYIARPNTLILVTIPMSGVSLRIHTKPGSDMCFTDDMENQQAVRLGRDADFDGERTIGRYCHLILDLLHLMPTSLRGLNKTRYLIDRCN